MDGWAQGIDPGVAESFLGEIQDIRKNALPYARSTLQSVASAITRLTQPSSSLQSRDDVAAALVNLANAIVNVGTNGAQTLLWQQLTDFTAKLSQAAGDPRLGDTPRPRSSRETAPPCARR